MRIALGALRGSSGERAAQRCVAERCSGGSLVAGTCLHTHTRRAGAHGGSAAQTSAAAPGLQASGLSCLCAAWLPRGARAAACVGPIPLSDTSTQPHAPPTPARAPVAAVRSHHPCATLAPLSHAERRTASCLSQT